MPTQAAPLPAEVSEVLSAPRAWMVRAGKKGAAIDIFLERDRVAVGWGSVGDLSSTQSRSDVRAALAGSFMQASPNKVGAIAGCLLKVPRTIAEGDAVITCDASSRTYNVGVVQAAYAYVAFIDFWQR